MTITDFIGTDVLERMKEEIMGSGGNEIFFRGIPDETGIVTDMEVIARGNQYSVAALLYMMKKNEVIIHNHPSGSIEPSVEDKNITKRLISCGEIIGIEVIDHIIIGDGMYFSFKENMII